MNHNLMQLNYSNKDSKNITIIKTPSITGKNTSQISTNTGLQPQSILLQHWAEFSRKQGG